MATTRITSNQQLNVVADLDFQNFKGINVGNPTAPRDIANKAYVDAVKQALDIKDSVRVATTGAETYTIVGGAVTVITGTQVDGVTLAVGNRILIKDAPAASGAGSANSTQPANGIYVVTNATTNLTVQRADDANISEEVTAGMFVFVGEGAANGDNGYVLTTNDTITLNTTGLNFTQFSGAGQVNAGAGLTKTGNTIDVVGSAGRIVVNADSIDLATVTTLGTASAAIRRIDFDSYGRVSGVINANLSDIISTIGSGLTANTVFAAGLSGAASFRLLAAADIPNLDTNKITTGILPIARGGTGLETVPTNGQLLIGNDTGYTLAGLTAGAGISITPGAGSITIASTGVTSIVGTVNQINVSASTGTVTLSTPQDIHTGATPTFARLSLSAGTVTISTPVLAQTQTWNAGAVTFVGGSMNIVDTASAAGSLFMDYQVGGSSRLAFRKDGTISVGIWGRTAVAATVGGTGQTVYAVGDLLFANTTTTLAKLAGVAVGNALISGGVSTAPSWGKVNLAAGASQHITGVLPIANGGTNLSATPTNGQLTIGNGTGYTLATLTGSATVSVTNGAGSITLAVITGATGVITAPNFIVGAVPTGIINGVNATFTLANTPLTGKEMIYVNGIRQQVGAGNDYTISGGTITFLSGAIPQTGDIILVDYLR